MASGRELLALDSVSNIGSKIGLLGFHTYLLEFLHFVDLSPLLPFYLNYFLQVQSMKTFKEHRIFVYYVVIYVCALLYYFLLSP